MAGKFLDFQGTACVEACETIAMVRTEVASIEGECVSGGADLENPVCPGGASEVLVETTENMVVVSRVCECNTDGGYILTASGNECVTDCPDGELLSLSGDSCVTECPVEGTVKGDLDADGTFDRCVCADDLFILENNSGCVATCDGVLSLDGTTCLSNCGDNEE